MTMIYIFYFFKNRFKIIKKINEYPIQLAPSKTIIVGFDLIISKINLNKYLNKTKNLKYGLLFIGLKLNIFLFLKSFS